MTVDYEYYKDFPMFKPLYEAWKRLRMRGALSEEWKDFERFYEWAMAEGYTNGARVVRADREKPADPTNSYIKFPTEMLEKKGSIKGGYKNRPCNECQYKDRESCAYRTCGRYIVWLNRSWEDFRKAAGISGEGKDNEKN